MKYSEIIELYKSGKLDNEQKEKVTADIEKHEAISEYLFDRDFSEDTQNNSYRKKSENENPDFLQKEADFTKYIRTSIRNTFIKTGIIIGFIVLAIVLFVVFAVPKIIDAKHYNPAEIVGTDSDGIETNRISLDLAVYSELFLPGKYREQVIATGNGNAKYDILITQNISFSSNFTNIGGIINKDKLLLFDSNLLSQPTVNKFVPAESLIDDGNYTTGNFGAAGSKQDAYKTLDNLNESKTYVAYVTLNSVMNYAEFSEWIQKNNIHANWCKMCFVNQSDSQFNNAKYYTNMNIGFRPVSSCSNLYFDEKMYPNLTQFSLTKFLSDDENGIVPEKDMTTHVVSLLRYLRDQEKFRKVIGLDIESSEFDALANNVEENGINIYGFVMIDNKESICALRDIKEIDYICTNEIKYE